MGLLMLWKMWPFVDQVLYTYLDLSQTPHLDFNTISRLVHYEQLLCNFLASWNKLLEVAFNKIINNQMQGMVSLQA